MNKTGGGFCLNRIIRANVRVRSPTIQSGHEPSSTENHQKPKIQDMGAGEKARNTDGNDGKSGGRRIAVVVDSSSEAKNALLWTLSHCVQEHDTVVLLHFLKAKPSKPVTGETCTDKRRSSRSLERVSALKNICLLKRPEVNTEGVLVEGEEKGPSIVEEARAQGAGLLVLGQKKKKKRQQSTTWRLLMIWAGQARPINGKGFVEYCINHSHCMAVAVRKKSKTLGGYTLTTKRHKDFWLLA
ncbi:PREDICTED: uncharacterized protein LOC104808507 [Tarenaya hassleriana]|uniref:uncharacterized protein LOC104808507 n=1 Tax=Tarenaya hassleriana TaxID=28532 RepID=UPI00053C6EB1|nr:PREDICTED: uncharacterized protein LOC104808507 [Tarenaya hassleriana]